MNEDRIQGKWKQIKGQLKAKWGELTDDDLSYAEGNRDYLLGKIQERYGLAKDRAEEQLKAFEKDLH
ncbi:MAG: hypothetical protein AMXMBFR76_19810 [Pseudomonadota bacterium]